MNAKIESTCDRFDQAEARLKSFTRSAVRTKVMLSLMSGEKDAGDLEDVVGLRSSTILHSIKEMIDVGLIVKSARGYALTNIGMIEASLLDNLVSTIVALDQHHDFWLNHDLSGIPMDILERIGMLTQSKIVAADSAALMKSIDNFIRELISSKEIYGISPVIVPGYSDAIYAAIENGAKVELILTGTIVDIISKEYPDMLNDLLKSEKFSLYRIDCDVRAAFTVTDRLLSLGLYRLDGTYDLGNDLICLGDNARVWGMELFEHYLSRSQLIKNI